MVYVYAEQTNKTCEKTQIQRKNWYDSQKKKEKETGMDFQIRAGRLVVWIFFFR
jgi:hypothetical protein